MRKTEAASTFPQRAMLALLASLAVFLAAASFAQPAQADFGFDGNGSFDVSFHDEGGAPVSQAGAHADFTTELVINDHSEPGVPRPIPDGRASDIYVDLPAGVLGDPTATPTCSQLDFSTISVGLFKQSDGCSPSSQIGVAGIVLAIAGSENPIAVPVFNMERRNSQETARIAFYVPAVGLPIQMEVSVRTESDYGLEAAAENLITRAPLRSTKLTLWSRPSDAAHDSQRYPQAAGDGQFFCGIPCTGPPINLFPLHPNPGLPPRAFTSLPTQCDQDLISRITAFDYLNPGVPAKATSVTPALTGCEDVPFVPTFQAEPTTNRSDKPTGLQVNLKIPQTSNPDVLASSHLKRAEVTLPEGVAISPTAAHNLEVCTNADLKMDSRAKQTCPDASKIGSVELDVPQLGTLNGYVVQRPQQPDETFRIAIVADGFGVHAKIPGVVRPDETTGQITSIFNNTPQTPFSEMRLRFFGGSGAALAMPQTCGTYETEAVLTPWARPDQPVTITDTFTIDRGADGSSASCVSDLAGRPFSPEMAAGVQSPVAGVSSPFIFRLTRPDGHQEILSTTVTPPKGVTAKLAGVPLCTNAQANAGTCPAASQVGEVIVGAGAGPSPFYIRPPDEGHVYMTEGYRGQQLGMLIQVPAKAGPFDLGLVNVRAAVHVNKHTAQLRVISDPIPQILEGVPLRVKDIRVKINRPDFTIAPTNCDPMTVDARVQGSHGASANLSNRFQVGGCASLGFNPRLKLDFGKRRKDTRRNQHPPLHANLNFNQGDANISYVQVALPKGVFLDQERLGRICSRPNYAAETCPAESRVGYAKATTPLLDDPVEGPVYLKSSDNPLPDLAADLNGQIDIDLFGKIDQKENKKGLAQIRNTFDVVPDVPVSHFSLTLSGGKDGLLVNSRNICRKRRSQKVSIEIRAHNEASLKQKPLIGSACKKINKKKAKKLRKKIKKLRRRAKKANSHKRAKRARHKGKKLKRKLRKLRR